MKFGAHVSTAKPFSDSIVRAKEIGCECIQIFANPPQRWNPVAIPKGEIDRFNKLKDEAGIDPIIIHAIYLVNLASSNSFFYEASKKSLIDDLKKAAMIGAVGTNVHIGSTKENDWKDCLPKIKLAILEILDNTSKETSLIIENSAGAGNVIGDTLEEIAEIIDEVKDDRVKVLIDTAHAYESGYDLKDQAILDKFIIDFDRLIGLDKLVGFHLNDSKTGISSHRDRHADIGKGEIGISAFGALVNHPKLQDKCGILETPQDEIPWQDQLKLLRNL